MILLPLPFPTTLKREMGFLYRTLSGQHSYGYARVAQLYERTIFRVNALSCQQDVFSTHVSMYQILILLQSGRKSIVSAASQHCSDI